MAETIAKALGGRKVGSSWIARCPTHADRDPSLSIRDGSDGKVLVRCHAGCDQADVIGVLRSRGLWSVRSAIAVITGHKQTTACHKPVSDHERKRRSEAADRLWRSCMPAGDTLAETYLRARGITDPIPPSLRFHPRLKHPSGTHWPAMVALVTGGVDGGFLAIHRTFLARDGSTKAPVEPQKMMLGPCRAGAVRLAAAGEHLMVGEGIETCLAATQSTGRSAWAALSTTGLRTLDLPPEVREVTVLADGDEPGEAAAQEAARRWIGQGRRVLIARPGNGLDFNDLLLGRAPRNEKGTA